MESLAFKAGFVTYLYKENESKACILMFGVHVGCIRYAQPLISGTGNNFHPIEKSKFVKYLVST